MNRKSLGIILFTFFIFSLMAYFPYKTNNEVELEIRNRVVKIDTIEGEYTFGCTGTLLSHNFILTNAHCFPSMKKQKPQIYIRRINDTEYTKAQIVGLARHTDFALLKFQGLDNSVQVEFTKDWHLGEDIILYGNPGIQDFVVGHSRIVGYLYIQTPLHKLRTMFAYPCNESAPGFSGSGIYNLKGEYMGTHELGEEIPLLYQIMSRLAGEPRQGPLCFAIPAKEAIERNLDRPWFGFNLKEKK